LIHTPSSLFLQLASLTLSMSQFPSAMHLS
jgi:hypothetical protein